jgi:transposase-like protein
MRDPNERIELIRAVAEGGATVRAAAARLGVPVSTAQRWVRIAAGKSSSVPKRKPRFVEAVVERVESSAIRVRIGVAEFEVRAGFDARLRNLSTSLRHQHASV